MRQAAQEGPYCPDGDSTLMVLPLRRQNGNIWNRSESNVAVTGWTAPHNSIKDTHTQFAHAYDYILSQAQRGCNCFLLVLTHYSQLMQIQTSSKDEFKTGKCILFIGSSIIVLMFKGKDVIQMSLCRIFIWCSGWSLTNNLKYILGCFTYLFFFKKCLILEEDEWTVFFIYILYIHSLFWGFMCHLEGKSARLDTLAFIHMLTCFHVSHRAAGFGRNQDTCCFSPISTLCQPNINFHITPPR